MKDVNLVPFIEEIDKLDQHIDTLLDIVDQLDLFSIDMGRYF